MARFAAGVAVLVVVATAVAGIIMTTRAARLFSNLDGLVTGTVAEQLDVRLESTARQLATDVAGAEEDEDWSSLQAELPRLAAADPSIVRLAVSDEEGLVVADSDPSRNGAPLNEPALAPMLRRPEVSKPEPSDVTLGGRPIRLVSHRISTGGGRARIVLVLGSPRAALELKSALEALHADAVHSGWIMVGLGGLVSLVVAVGAVLLAGSSIARRLRVVAWRVAQLGSADRGMHVRLDGPTELQHVGRELELAAERLAVAGDARRIVERDEADQRSFAAVVRAALGAHRVVGAVTVTIEHPPEATTARALATTQRPDGTVAVLFVERVGRELADAVAAAELRSAGLAFLSGDAALTPVTLLERLDAITPVTSRARAVVAFIDKTGAGHSLRLASAGAGFPTLRRTESPRTLVVRGDRLGEASSAARTEVSLELQSGDAIVLSAERVAGERPLPAVTLQLA